MKDKSAGAGSGKKAGEVLKGAMEGIEKMVSGAGAKTKDFAAKTQKSIVNAMDKNDDGKIDMADFGMENDIKKLIEMRINASNDNKIESKTYRLECSKSSGIREKTTAEIDAVLGQLKCSGTASISSEAQRENRTILEYSIEF